MDGIVVNLMGPWLKAYNALYGDTLNEDEVDTWHVTEIVKCSHDQMMAIIQRPGFFRSLPPIRGAIEGVRELMRRGHEVRFCSAPCGPRSLFEKFEWLHHWFGPETAQRAFLCYEKHWLRADLLIDDKPETLAAWDGFSATIEYPYNTTSAVDCLARSYEDTEKAWATILAFVEALEATPSVNKRYHRT